MSKEDKAEIDRLQAELDAARGRGLAASHSSKTEALDDPAVPSTVARALASIGWEIEAVEIDLHRGRAMVIVRRADGRWLRLDADGLGRASVERWHRRREWYRSKGAAGVERVVDDFLGRDRATGAGSALRLLASYVAENPAPGRKALSLSDVRRALVLAAER